MTTKHDYTVMADGWVAGKWCAGGSIVSLTEAQAKYENVHPVVIGIDLAKGDAETTTDKPKGETTKRSRSKK